MSSSRPGREPPRELLRRLADLPPTAISVAAYRHVARGRDPLSGEGARIHGGRWNPPESFPALYLGLSEETVEAEFARMAARQGLRVDDFLPREFITVRVELAEVLDLRSAQAQQALRLVADELRSDDVTTTQTLGAAAHILGLEGIAAPSATGVSDVLAAFPDRLRVASVIAVVDRRLRA